MPYLRVLVCFIAFIGLKNAGIIVSSPATYVTLGAFTPTAILGIIAIVLSGILMARKVKGSLFYGIVIATLIGIPMGVTVLPKGWLPVSMPHSVSPIFCKFDFTGFLSLKTCLVVLSLLMVNIFDTIRYFSWTCRENRYRLSKMEVFQM